MTYVAGALVAFFATFLLMPRLARIAERVGLVDHPARRKVHSRPIPVCGGIAMACGASIALVLSGVRLDAVLPYALGALLLVGVGVVDDARDIGYRLRLACQCVAACIVAAGGITIGWLPFAGPGGPPAWLDVAASVGFIVAVTNAVNLLDGLDGLAGGCVLLSLIAIGLVGGLDGEAMLLLVVVAAAILAFLRHNTHPARVFMGDAGSTFLGFTLAVVALMAMRAAGGSVSPLLLPALIGLPLIDTAKVFCERLLHGRSPFTADRRHIHHRLLAAGLRHDRVVAACYLIQGAMVFTAALLHGDGHLAAATLFVAVTIAVIAGCELAARRGGGEPGAAGGERRNLWLRRRAWLPAASRRAVRIAVAGLLVVGAALPVHVPADLALLAIVLAAGLLAAQRLGGDAALAALRAGVLATVIVIGALAVVGTAGVPAAAMALAGAALAAVLALAIRVTRRALFPISPHDVLVAVVAGGVLVAAASGLIGLALAGPAIAALALLYGCEYLLADDRVSANLLRNAAVASLLIVAGRGILV